MRNKDLQDFIEWSHEFGDVTCSEPNLNQSARLDIDTDFRLGRITYWSTGDCDAEVIDVESEETIYQAHWSDLKPAAFGSVFAEFFNAIRLKGDGGN